MMWCFYCNREIDEHCELCIYKQEAEEVADSLRMEMELDEELKEGE